MSGAVRGPVNVFEAVAQCRKLGFADADITVDVVYTSASFLLQRDVSKDTTLFVVLRDDNIKKYVAATQDVLYAKLAYTDVNFRYDVMALQLFQLYLVSNLLGTFSSLLRLH